jgi:hypothetical protein
VSISSVCSHIGRRAAASASSPPRRCAVSRLQCAPLNREPPTVLARSHARYTFPTADSSTVTPLYSAFKEAISDSTGARHRIILVASLASLPPRYRATHRTTLYRRDTMHPAHSADLSHTSVHTFSSASHAAAASLDTRVMSSDLSTLTLAARDSSAPLDGAEPEFSKFLGHSSAGSLQPQGQALGSRDGREN